MGRLNVTMATRLNVIMVTMLDITMVITMVIIVITISILPMPNCVIVIIIITMEMHTKLAMTMFGAKNVISTCLTTNTPEMKMKTTMLLTENGRFSFAHFKNTGRMLTELEMETETFYIYIYI